MRKLEYGRSCSTQGVRLAYDVQLASTTFYRSAEDVGQYVPAQLLRQANGAIGQPDTGDWGGYYLKVNENGKRGFRLIDPQKRNLPAYLPPLVDTLRARIDKLS